MSKDFWEHFECLEGTSWSWKWGNDGDEELRPFSRRGLVLLHWWSQQQSVSIASSWVWVGTITWNPDLCHWSCKQILINFSLKTKRATITMLWWHVGVRIQKLAVVESAWAEMALLRNGSHWCNYHRCLTRPNSQGISIHIIDSRSSEFSNRQPGLFSSQEKKLMEGSQWR